MNITDIENAVNKIQQDIFDSTGGVEYYNISLSSNGYYCVVEFCDIVLWSSEDDDREYLSPNFSMREDIEDYLRRTLKEEIYKLSTIHV